MNPPKDDLLKIGRGELDFTVSRLINSTGTAEGTSLPPRMSAGLRVPIVTGLRILKINNYFGGTEITLQWNEPPNVFRSVNGYNVYVRNLNGESTKPQGPFFARGSPATVRLVTSETTTVVLTVQTVLKNGQTSELGASPSVSTEVVIAQATSGDFPHGVIPVSAIENGTVGNIITWNGSGFAVSVSKSAANIVLGNSGLSTVGRAVEVSSAGTVTQSSFTAAQVATAITNSADAVQGRASLVNTGRIATVSATPGEVTETTFSASDVVLGAPDLVTPNSLAFVGSAGTLDEASGLSWNDSTKLLTQTQTTLGNPLSVLQTTASGTDPNETLYQNKVTTTNATPAVIHTLAIPASTTVGFEGHIVARRTGGAAGTAEDGAFYRLAGVFKNVSGSAAAVGSGTLVTAIGEDQAAWDVTFNLTGSNVEIEVTGAADNNVSWILNLRTYAVST
jgi:hypothetical protein